MSISNADIYFRPRRTSDIVPDVFCFGYFAYHMFDCVTR